MCQERPGKRLAPADEGEDSEPNSERPPGPFSRPFHYRTQVPPTRRIPAAHLVTWRVVAVRTQTPPTRAYPRHMLRGLGRSYRPADEALLAEAPVVDVARAKAKATAINLIMLSSHVERTQIKRLPRPNVQESAPACPCGGRERYRPNKPACVLCSRTRRPGASILTGMFTRHRSLHQCVTSAQLSFTCSRQWR